MKRIAIIPARSGSKGLRDKNIKELNGKPLIVYSIESAIESGKFDKVFVSTDSREYADIAQKYGADASFLRSKKNSGDTAGSWDAVREVIDILNTKGEEYDEVMLLQATSPLRTAEDIINAINLLHERKARSVVSLTECDHSPIWCNTLPKDGNMDNFDRAEYKDLPRQSLPTYYRYNGAIYLVTNDELYNTDRMFERGCYAYIMPQNRSIDIDTALDFLIAETIMKAGV
mgnify:CR=1 FL=1